MGDAKCIHSYETCIDSAWHVCILNCCKPVSHACAAHPTDISLDSLEKVDSWGPSSPPLCFQTLPSKKAYFFLKDGNVFQPGDTAVGCLAGVATGLDYEYAPLTGLRATCKGSTYTTDTNKKAGNVKGGCEGGASGECLWTFEATEQGTC